MKKLSKGFFTLAAATLTLVATNIASTACTWFFYQPEEPKSLREE